MDMKRLLIWVLLVMGVYAMGNIKAITEDGRTVILHLDMTWEYDLDSEWRTVATFSGDSAKATHPFTIRSDVWRIYAQSHGSMLQIYMHKPGDDMYMRIPLMMSSPGDEETYVYEKGTFYFDLLAMGWYKIVVEEKVQ